MESKLKTWQKVGLGVLTVGITVTTIYYGYKGLKKLIAKKEAEKAKPEVKK